MSDLQNKKSLMTHIVLGYPDMKTNLELIKVMLDAGVDFIEMQIPFSDPIADGTTILTANQKALQNKISVSQCFDFAGTVTGSFSSIDFLFMTYYNIIFNYGIDNFVKKSKQINLYGLIVPDIPVEEDKENFFPTCKTHKLNSIYVFSPTTNEKRLRKIRDIASGFVYCTSRIGTTGAKKNPRKKLESYIKSSKKILDFPIAVGFGIDSAEKANTIARFADIIIIGSKIINIMNESGKNFQKDVYNFLYNIKRAIS